MSTLSFVQIEDLWKANGGNPNAAPLMAAIATAESGGRTDAHNARPPDDSWGLWQINYYGRLGPGRTASYGTPAQLVADPNRQARAAIGISANGSNPAPWTTYTSGAYRQFLPVGSPGIIPALPTLATGAGTGPQQGTDDTEGSWTMPGPIPNVSRPLVRKILGGMVLVSGAVVGVVGVFIIAGRGVKLPGPAGIVQGAVQQRREGRHEEARVTSAAEGRRRALAEKTDAARQADNRREARAAVADRRRQNAMARRREVVEERQRRDAQRQEDALQRIEARRTAALSSRRTSRPGPASREYEPF